LAIDLLLTNSWRTGMSGDLLIFIFIKLQIKEVKEAQKTKGQSQN
jgi:hypothetical protein